MKSGDISEIVRTVVERVVHRLESTGADNDGSAGLFGAQPDSLLRALAEGAARVSPQALSPAECGDLLPRLELILLRPDAREADIHALCREALQLRCAAVCVMPEWTEAAAALLKGSPVRLSATIGFPTGTQATETKCAEVRRAVGQGADEVDVVMNLARLRAADYRGALEDLQSVVRAAQGKPVKAVIEAAVLTREEKAAAAILAKAAGARYIKSATGFGPDGICIADVALIRAALNGSPISPDSASPAWTARVGAVVCIEANPA
ncbi:MAG: deoxyribose-phosphate aldolase [Candidatus Sumerlaeia bacterium]|nr:deoxyribose-phosphate aldolase [Candidatus Sumerlaeia bacterium]